MTRHAARATGAGMAALALAFVLPAPGVAQDLGPADGDGLPPTDIERVAEGDEAPLFVLESFAHGRVGLADFRGEKNVVLVFYRGHW